MKLPNWLKITWWIILIIFFSYLAAQRYDSIIEGSSTTTDIFIFLIWVALITAPLFRAVNVFGIGFKNEFDNFKNEVRGQILNLRSEIQNTVTMSAEISPQIQILTPLPDSKLIELKNDFKSILEQTLKEKGIEKEIVRFDIPNDTTFLFKVRYSIESELRRISKQLQDRTRLWKIKFSKEPERPQSIFQITRSLDELGIITHELSNIIREVYRVCTPAIHGEEVSQTALGFVKDIAPGLIASLKNIWIA